MVALPRILGDTWPLFLASLVLLGVTWAVSMPIAHASDQPVNDGRSQKVEVPRLFAAPLLLPSRVSVRVRRRERGEIGVAEPIVLTLGANREAPVDLDPPPPVAIDMVSRRDWVEALMPEPRRVVVAADLIWFDAIIPRSRRIVVAADLIWFDAIIPPSRRIVVASDHKWIEGDVPPLRSLVLSVHRKAPEIVMITEPLRTSSIVIRFYPRHLWPESTRPKGPVRPVESAGQSSLARPVSAIR